MKVEIWSDVLCRWCYIGKRRFEAALARFDHRDDAEVDWKAFDLDPSASSVSAPGSAEEGGHAGRLARKYGTDVAAAQQMLDSMTAAAAAEGLDFHFERAVRANTADAHQVIHLAGLRGAADAVKERLLLAYFTGGEALGDRETLVRLAGEAGLDEAEVRARSTPRRTPALSAAMSARRPAEISGVPFFVIDRKYGVSGAQPPEVLLQVLDKAWADSHALLALTTIGAASGDATVCGPDGCPV